MVCRVCDSQRLELAIDLGEQPWANHFLRPESAGSEPRYPLRVVHCQTCGTAQLDYTVRKETLFGDHTYLSGITRTLRAHFEQMADVIERRFFPSQERKAVLDIGSNDGTQLAAYQARGWDVLGVESSRPTAALANANNVPTVEAFFNDELAAALGRRFDVVNAAGVFFHLEELHSVTDGIRRVLAGDGVFVVQALSMQRIVENLAFDQIYHEHLLYYTATTLDTLLRRHGLAIFDCEISPIHGGSLIAYAGHVERRSATNRLRALLAAEALAGANTLEWYRRFAAAIGEHKARNLAFLEGCHRSKRRVYGFGAPVKGNTLLNYFGIDRRLVQCLVEKNPLRRGLVSPGMHIPVILEEDVVEPPDVYYVLAWNFRNEILANNRALIDRGVDFHFPVVPREVAA